MESTAQYNDGSRGFDTELKLVTSLFVDLVGSLETISTMGAQQASAFFEDCRKQLIQIAHQHNGTIGTVAGDGILFLFGAPTADSKHASNACLAALDMMSGAERISRTGRQVELRIGMSTGETLVKPVQIDIGWHYDATGISVHVASRLQALAPTGAIVMEQLTHELAGNGFVFEDLGMQPIRGLRQTPQIYKLCGLKAKARAAVKSGGGQFIGRSNELRQLLDICREPAGESARVVLLVGDPGIGKSRLVSEVNRAIEMSNAQHALYCRGFYGLFEPFSAVRECIQQMITQPDQITRDMFLDEVRKSRPIDQTDEDLPASIGNLHSALFGNDDPDEPLAVRKLENSIGKKLYAIRHGFMSLIDIKRPNENAIFLIDEFLELDNESKEIFFHLMSPQSKFPGTFILACRSERVGELLARDIANIEMIKIAGLSASDAVELARDISALETTDDQTHQQKQDLAELAHRSGGNPLFLQEMLTALWRKPSDPSPQPGPASLARSMAQTPVLQSVIAERIDQFSPEQKQVLKIASVLGEEFPGVILSKVLLRLNFQWSLVEELVAGRVLTLAQEPGSGFLRFTHPLFREVSASSIVEEDEIKFNAAAFAVTEPGQGLGGHALALTKAHHAQRARLWVDAGEYYRRAGVLSNGRAMNSQAMTMFNEALATTEHLSDQRHRARTRVDLLLEMRNPLFQIGDLQGVANCLNEAKSILSEADDPRQRGKILSFESHVSWLRGQPSAALDAGRKVSDIAKAIDDNALSTRANFHMGLANLAFGNDVQAVDLLGRVVAAISGGVHSDYLGVNLGLLVLAQSYLARSLMYCGDISQSVAAAQHGLNAAEQSDDIFSHIIAHISAGIVQLPAGQLEASQLSFESALKLLNSVEARLMRPVFEVNQGLLFLCQGDTARGQELIESSIHESTKIDLNFEMGKKYLYLSLCHLVTGNRDAALDALNSCAHASVASKESKVADIAAHMSERIEADKHGRLSDVFDGPLMAYPAISALMRSKPNRA